MISISFRGLFHGFKWLSSDTAFSKEYDLSRVRKNYHVIFFQNSWCVHAEGTREITKASSRSEAIELAKKRAMAEGTEALIHRQDATLEECFTASAQAFPQERIDEESAYPKDSQVGEQVL